MKKLWGGRFKSELSDSAKRFSYSLATDRELLGAEIKVSMAHALMLGKTGVLSERESKELVQGLWKVLAELKKKDLLKLVNEYEDIHTVIQSVLEKKVGPLAKKIHTARSRNDLVATSTRLYLREKVTYLLEGIRKVQAAFLQQAEKNQNVSVPGYTHLQRAQVVLAAHQFLAYVEMLERDSARLQDARERFNECPLGSGALAGTGIAIDRIWISRLLGFRKPTANSLDAVSDRDFIVETLSALSVLFMHLSRIAEDLILWNSQEFQFVTMDDQYSTGSSLMPHKKNPDMLELIRGKTGEAYGNLLSVLVTMKGLPHSYNRDMQEDKAPLFRSIYSALGALDVLEGVVRTFKVEKDNCLKASKDSFLFATDLLEYLVKKKIPVREAHDIVGGLVHKALESHSTLSGLSLEVYQKYSKAFKKDVFQLFDPAVSVKSKSSLGSTNPELVKKQIKIWKEKLKDEFRRIRREKLGGP